MANEKLIHMPEISKARDSPSDCLMSYPVVVGLTPLQRYSRCILQPQTSGFKIVSGVV